MYKFVIIGKTEKTYKKLGNAFNAFWKEWNAHPLKDEPFMYVVDKTGYCFLACAGASGLRFPWDKGV